jgi:hypothetical protein
MEFGSQRRAARVVHRGGLLFKSVNWQGKRPEKGNGKSGN